MAAVSQGRLLGSRVITRNANITIRNAATRRHFSLSQTQRESETPKEYANETLKTLQSRRLLQDVSSSFISPHLSRESQSIYLGIDPTANSLHVGNLLPIIALIWLVKAGHKGVLLVGGATGSIGDPSGKTSERSDLPREVLEQNVAGITRQLEDLVARIGEHLGAREPLPIQVLNNADFYKDLNVLTFLKDVGRFVRIGEVLARDSVKTRLPPPHGTSTSPNAGLSFTEFSYQLLQAYDFYLLNKRPDTQCTIQLGGSDQMGNIMAGVELIRRKQFGAGAEQSTQASSSSADASKRPPPAYALTIPLLTTSRGEKLGKSAGNALFLSPSLCSDYELYQYFIRLSDEDAGRFLTSLTFLNSDEVQVKLRNYGRDDPRKVQKVLADEMITMLRGKQGLEKAKETTRLLYGVLFKADGLSGLRRAVWGEGETLWEKLHDISSTAGKHNETSWVVKKIKRGNCVGKPLLSLFVDLGFKPSKAQVRDKLKTTSGLHLNNHKITTPAQDFAKLKLKENDIVSLGGSRGFFLLQSGKHDVRVILVE